MGDDLTQLYSSVSIGVGWKELDLEAIRARNEEDREALQQSPHRSEGDKFYSCPANPEYGGLDSSRECDCDNAERAQRIADIDALLAEVISLRAALHREFLRRHGL